MLKQRRDRENLVESMNQHVNNDYKLRHQATWELRTDKVIQNNQVKRRLGQLRQIHEEQLRNRRNKLAALLAAEDEMYKQEYIENQITPEDVRAKMAERLMELRTQREKAREEDVQARLDKRIKQAADELRLETSKIEALKTKLAQE